MIQRLTIAIAVLAVLIGSVGYFAYTAWEAHIILNGPPVEVILSDVQIAENRENIVRVLTDSAGVSMSDALRGFWYRYIDEYGVEQVAFLNPNELAKEAMTQWQIANIGDIVAEAKVSGRDTLTAVNVADMPDEYQFHNALYSVDKDGSFVVARDALESRIASGEYVESDLFRLGYIYELEGKYIARDELNMKSCKEFGARCEAVLTVRVSGQVIDMDGMPIQSATVSVLSAGDLTGMTDTQGKYAIDVPVRKMEKLRIKAVKRNYSDGVVNAVVVTVGKKEYQMDDIILASPLKIVTLDTTLGTITGDVNTYAHGVFTIQTPQSHYSIPASAIVYKGGAVYMGEVEVYLYEFTRDTAPESLLAVDTMDSVMGYAGDLMKSFGMPYIQFFTPLGEELHVLKSNPMGLQYKIYHMESLYNNTDGIYTALTHADMESLVLASLRGNYPIDREYLIRNNLLQFPAFWVFDRTVGIWENVGINVITADGLIESIFYTINDSR